MACDCGFRFGPYSKRSHGMCVGERPIGKHSGIGYYNTRKNVRHPITRSECWKRRLNCGDERNKTTYRKPGPFRASKLVKFGNAALGSALHAFAPIFPLLSASQEARGLPYFPKVTVKPHVYVDF